MASRLTATGVLVAALMVGTAECRPSVDDEAATEIQKLGGEVIIDENTPGRKIWWVSFSGLRVTDAGLERLKGMKGLAHLHTLELCLCPQVTDAGVAHLQGFTRLQKLTLWETQVTDAGLVHLRGLTQLKKLELGFCPQVTDAGLEHLTGLTQLQWLYLNQTKVTDAGVAELKKALPNVYIIR